MVQNAEQIEHGDEMIPRSAMELMADLVQVSVGQTQSTVNWLMTRMQEERNGMAQTFLGLYHAIACIPDHSRSVYLESLLVRYAHASDMAQGWVDGEVA